MKNKLLIIFGMIFLIGIVSAVNINGNFFGDFQDPILSLILSEPEYNCYASEVIDYSQGKTYSGNVVGPERSNVSKVLGSPDSPDIDGTDFNFFSLGLADNPGSNNEAFVIVSFETPIIDVPGDDVDVTVFETTWDNPPWYAFEKVEVFASLDNVNYYSLGIVIRDGGVDLADSGLFEANYIKLVDRTNRSEYDGIDLKGDGYDVDAIQAVCQEAEPECGNGVLDEGEECDDGNLIDGDGCDENCEIECIDKDEDCICDDEDLCLDSRSGEPVDENGCDPFQFCEPFYCGLSCVFADFRPVLLDCEEIIPAEEGKYPMDCTTVVISKEGSYFPKCVPLTCAN